MSNKSKTMGAVSTAFSFAGDKIVTNLAEFIRRENIELTESQIKQFNSIVKSSVEQSFVLSSESIEKSLLTR